MRPEECPMRSMFAAALVMACPAWVYATVIVKTDLEPPPGGVYLPGQTVDFDVYLENTDPAHHDRVNVFTIVIEGPGFGIGPGLPHFLIPPADIHSGIIRYPLPSASHPYLFTDHLGDSNGNPYPEDFTNTISDADSVALIASLADLPGVEITSSRNGLARLSVVIPPDAVPGRYPIEIGHDTLALGWDFGPVPEAQGQDAFIVVVPEPSAAAMLPLLAATALTRRHRREVLSERRRIFRCNWGRSFA